MPHEKKNKQRAATSAHLAPAMSLGLVFTFLLTTSMQGHKKQCFISCTSTNVDNAKKNERNSKGNDQKQAVKALRDFHYFKRPNVR